MQDLSPLLLHSALLVLWGSGGPNDISLTVVTDKEKKFKVYSLKLKKPHSVLLVINTIHTSWKISLWGKAAHLHHYRYLSHNFRSWASWDSIYAPLYRERQFGLIRGHFSSTLCWIHFHRFREDITLWNDWVTNGGILKRCTYTDKQETRIPINATNYTHQCVYRYPVGACASSQTPRKWSETVIR